MQWIYLDANQQQVPVEEEAVGGLVEQGIITGDTLLWSESLPDWQAAAEVFPGTFVAEETPAPAEAEPPKVIRPAPKIGLVKRQIKTARELELEPPPAVSDSDLIRDLASFLGAHAGWMKFYAVISIIGGVILCLTVVGAIVGWLPIWLGVILLKAANLSVTAQYSGYQEELEEALDRAGFFFKVQGITILVIIIFYAVLFAALFFTGLAASFVVQPPAQLG